jgi:hypothetical protein
MVKLTSGFRPQAREKSKTNGKTKSHDCNVIDASKMPYTEYGTGVVKGNPRLCISCRKPIRKGQAWRKDTSAADPEFGRYSVIAHADCR